jgi:two-component system sensor histidine kinase YesM
VFKRLQSKIFFSFILLVLIPLLCLGTFAYLITTRFLEEQHIHDQTQTTALVGEKFKSLLEDAEDITSYIANNETIQTLLTQSDQTYINAAQKSMFEYLSNLKKAKSYISFLVIYGENGFIFGDFRDYYRQIVSYEDLKQSPTYNVIAAKDGEAQWASSSSPLFILGHSYNEHMIGRRIVSIYDPDKKLGMLFLGINEPSLAESIRDIQIGRTTNIFLFDDNYNLSASKQQEKDVEKLIEQDLPLKKQILQSNQTQVMRLGRKDYYVSSSSIQPYNWTVVSMTPLLEVRKSHEIVLRFTLILSLALLLVVGLISAFLSRSITSPIKKLLRSMHNFKRGDFNQKLPVRSKDEIGMLTHKYNDMVAELNELIRKVYISQTHQKIIELKTLQAQIEPHFLYNTLDFIFLNAKVNGDDQTAEVVRSLSELFRISLNQGKDYYTLEDEFRQIRSYIRIQHARFPQRFQPIFDIEPGVESFYTMKLLLQPIVENAIIHAFDRNDERNTLRISGAEQDGKIKLTVEDNGRGMPEEEVRRLLTTSQDDGGYGIRNVNERLKMLFGDEYGLQIESGVGLGTKVTVFLPMIESEHQWRLLYESHGDR